MLSARSCLRDRGWWSATVDCCVWQMTQIGSRLRTAARNAWCPLVVYPLSPRACCAALVWVGHRGVLVMLGHPVTLHTRIIRLWFRGGSYLSRV